MPYIIKQDHEKCVGCGACVAVCSDNWEIGEDGKARPKNQKVEEIGCNKEAMEACPVQCISIEEE